MTIQSLINANKIVIDTNFSNPSDIQTALETVYSASSIFRNILDDLNDPGRILYIDFQSNAAGVPGTIDGGGNFIPGNRVKIDPVFVETLFSLDLNGNFEQVSFERALTHEVIHAVAKLLDPPVMVPYNQATGILYAQGYDYHGPTVTKTEEISDQVGFSDDGRASYTSIYDPNITNLPTHYQYTNNTQVNVGIFWFGPVNTIGGNTKDLIIGYDGLGQLFLSGDNDDFLYGLGGEDTLDAGAGADEIYGGADNDTLLGGGGADLIYGDNDDIRAAGAFSGIDGNDSISGEGGNDTLVGGAGNDTIDGGDDVDTVNYSYEGTGLTTGISVSVDFLSAPSDPLWQIGVVDRFGDTDTLTNVEVIVGTTYADTFIISGDVPAGFTLTLDANGTSGESDPASVDTVDVSNIGEGTFISVDIDGNVEIKANSVVTTSILLPDFNGRIVGSDFGDTFQDLSSGSNATQIDGGGGNDDLDGGAGNDSLFGGEGVDSVTGGAGDDLLGNIHAPTFDYASFTPTELQAFIDSEDNGVETTLSGGAGDDIYLIDYSSAFDPQSTHGAGDFSIDDTDPGTMIFVRDIVTGAIDPLGGTIIPITDTIPAVVSEIDIGDGEIVRCTQSSSVNTTFGFIGEESGAFYVFGNIEGGFTISGPEEHCGTSPGGGGGADPGAGQLRIVRYDSPADFYQSGAGGGTGSAANRIVITSSTLTFNDLVKGARPDLGLDTISGGGGPAPSTSSGVTTMAVAGGYSATGTAGDDFVFSITGTQDVDLLGGDDTTFTGDSNDTIDGGAGNDSLVGGGGDDDITGGSGADTIDGGDGLDTIRGGTSGDALMGAAGNDSLLGEGGADTLEGGDGVDTLEGGDGNDTILGGAQSDLLFGGAGADYLNGGDGLDTADYSAALTAITVDLAAGTGAGDIAAGDVLENIEIVLGGGGGDTLRGVAATDVTLKGANGNDRVEGNSGNDLVNGGAGGDTLRGADGDDTMNGGSGDDTMFGGSGADLMNGGDGADRMRAEAGNDTVNGDAGDDRLFGSFGFDELNGGDGDDYIEGNGGNDTLIGGNGADTLLGATGWDSIRGGAGNDEIETNGGNDSVTGGGGNDTITADAGDETFTFFTGDDADRINGFVAGSGTQDVIQLVNFGGAFDSFAEVSAASSQVGADTVIDFGGGDTITLAGVSLVSLHQDDFVFA